MIKRLILAILFPALVLAQPIGGDKVDLSRYGGTATTLGQKAKASSIPMTLATEQDTAEYDSSNLVYFNRVGVPWFDSGGGIGGWKPWPIVGDGFSQSTPFMACGALDAGSSAILPLLTSTSGPSPGSQGVQTHTILYGWDGTSTNQSPWAVNSTPSAIAYGLVTRNIPSGTQTVSGTITSTPANWSTATLSNVSASATSVTLIASNANRKEVTIVNESAYALFIKYGSSATSTSYTHQLAGSPSGYPYAELTISAPLYTGIITGVWQLASGNARVTEGQ